MLPLSVFIQLKGIYPLTSTLFVLEADLFRWDDWFLGEGVQGGAL